MEELSKQTGLEAGEQNKKFDVDFACCLGCCDFGPNILVNDNLVLNVKPETIMGQIQEAVNKSVKTTEEKQKELDKVLDGEL